MAEAENQSTATLDSARPPNPIWVVLDCAGEAFGSAMTLWIMGGLLVGLVGIFAGDMIPSLPPGFSDAGVGNHAHGKHHGWWHALGGSSFVIFFVIFFAHSLYEGFRGKRAGLEKRARQILAKLREDWFELIVENGFGAWIAVLMLEMMPNLSWTHLVSQWLWELAFPYIRGLAHLLFGASNTSTLHDWITWYDGNSSKFYFWVFYLGSIMDDLGVPNFKTLLRWGWRRVRNRRNPVVPVALDRPGAR
jgi:hypothetical protein